MTVVKASPTRKIAGHPRGLVILFFVEMWERFSYYGMRALLILYLTQHFLFTDRQAQGIYASYASLVYLMPLLGGFLADRYLGPRKAVLYGALLLSAGHFVMTFEGSGSRQIIYAGTQRWEIIPAGDTAGGEKFAFDGVHRLPLAFTVAGAEIGPKDSPFRQTLAAGAYRIERRSDPMGEAALYLALSLIILGVGFLKSNISTLLGTLYENGDPNRDAGFTIFYIGINLGSVMATTLCGWLGLVYGWRWGFGLAGVGMLIGLATFLSGIRLLEGRGEPPRPFRPVWALYTWLGALVAIAPVWWLVQHDETTSRMLVFTSVAAFVAMLGWSIAVCRGAVRARMIVAIVLILFAVVFRTLLNQAGSTITLYAARFSDLHVWGDLRMTAAQTTLFNPVFIVTIAPLVAALSAFAARRGRDPAIPIKFAIGLLLAGASFLTLSYGAKHFAFETALPGGTAPLVPLIWLVLFYLLQTVGEILVAPLGLSMITKLSAPGVTGLMMGMWYLASSLAYSIAGEIGKRTANVTASGVALDPHAQLGTYSAVFDTVGWTGITAGVALLAASPALRRRMRGAA